MNNKISGKTLKQGIYVVSKYLPLNITYYGGFNMSKFLWYSLL